MMTPSKRGKANRALEKHCEMKNVQICNNDDMIIRRHTHDNNDAFNEVRALIQMIMCNDYSIVRQIRAVSNEDATEFKDAESFS